MQISQLTQQMEPIAMQLFYWFGFAGRSSIFLPECSGEWRKKMFKQTSILALVVGVLVGCASTPDQPLDDATYKTWASEQYGLENCHQTGRLSTADAATGKTLLDAKVNQARQRYSVDLSLAESEYQLFRKSGPRAPDSWCLNTAVAITQTRQQSEARERKADRAAASPTVIVQPPKTCNTVLGWTHCM